MHILRGVLQGVRSKHGGMHQMHGGIHGRQLDLRAMYLRHMLLFGRVHQFDHVQWRAGLTACGARGPECNGAGHRV